MKAPLSISIVTPSFNQGRFIEETIRSVLDQGYPALQYVIMDGGSTDDSVQIIRKYADRLCHWQSQADGGQYAAINAGFAQTNGEIMAWINSDDKYLPGALSVVSDIFSRFPEVEWLTTSFPLNWDRDGRAVRCFSQFPCDRFGFYLGETLPAQSRRFIGWIQQESTFWRRSLWERAGGRLDTTLRLAADFELWARFYQLADLYYLATPLGGIRNHGDQKSALQMDVYMREAREVLGRYSDTLPGGRWLFRSRYCRLLPKRVRSALGWTRRKYLIQHLGGDAHWVLGGWTE